MLYDLIIIGAGPAGLTASIYASRYKINHLIFGIEPGGQASLAPMVENYPGFLSIKGAELMQRFVEQVGNYGVKIRQEKVAELKSKVQSFDKLRIDPEQSRTGQSPKSKVFLVKTADGQEYQARTLILAMGAAFRKLDIPGEDKFLGRGVSYCATCDAPFFKEKTVAVVGGGDCAIAEALHLALFAKKVYLIHRRGEFRAEPAWIEKLEKEPKIEKILENQVMEIKGTERVKEVALEKPYKESNSLPLDGVFVEIGHIPSSVLTRQLGVELNDDGYVKITPEMETNVLGVFAAGDLVEMTGRTIFRQLIAASADGARAAASVYHYLRKNTPSPSWGRKVSI